MEIPAFLIWCDSYLIRLYRVTGSAYADFVIGTLVLAFIAVMIGEASIHLASLAIRNHVQGTATEARRYQNLSMEALKTGDKEAYSAANKLANDAFGKSFFQQLALSAGFFWPGFLAVGWMEYRFAGVEFPLPGTSHSLGYLSVFILLYIAAYLLWKQVKYRLPHFRRIQEDSEPLCGSAPPAQSLANLLPPEGKNGKV